MQKLFFQKSINFYKLYFNYLLIFFFVLRMSFLFVSVVLGFTVFLSSFLKLVPFPVLYGVFLYMGVSSIGGIQFIDRLFLLLMPVKHHPSVSYIRRVRNKNFVKLIHCSSISRKKFFYSYRYAHGKCIFSLLCNFVVWPYYGGSNRGKPSP